MIQEMQNQLPRLSLFEIHVNNSNKQPASKPVSNVACVLCSVMKFNNKYHADSLHPQDNWYT